MGSNVTLILGYPRMPPGFSVSYFCSGQPDPISHASKCGLSLCDALSHPMEQIKTCINQERTLGKRHDLGGRPFW